MLRKSFALSLQPIVAGPPAFSGEEGAEVQFLGVVRGLEEGRAISGIEYTAYLPMAEKELEDLLARAGNEQSPHQVYVQHRLGFVATGEPSILIQVQAKHSAEAFHTCQWYLREIKSRVPIWKKPLHGPAPHES